MERGQVRRAHPAEIMERLEGVRANVVLCGHTHTARLVQLTDTVLIVNPGSVGVPAYADTEPESHVVESGSPHARYVLLNQSDQGWRGEFVAVAYDHMHAANQARRNGRLDWEVALRTGYMLPERQPA